MKLFIKSIIVIVIFNANMFANQNIQHSITIEEAVKLAIKNNSDLATARLEVKRADARVMEAWGNTMPSIDLSSQYVRLLEKPTTYFPDFMLYGIQKALDPSFNKKPKGEFIPLQMAQSYSTTANFTAKQILFNGAVFIGVGAASTYSELARELYSGKKSEIIAKVKKAYYSAQLAKEVFMLVKSSLKNAEDNLKNVKVMREQGIVSEYDELRAIVAVDNIMPNLIQSENNYNTAVSALCNMIGLERKDDIELSNILQYNPSDSLSILNAEKIVLEKNPNLLALKKQIDLNGDAINVERSNYLPTIALFGGLSFSAYKDKFNFSTRDFLRSSQVGISLSLNLFQGFQNYYRVEQAQVEQRKSEEQKINLERSLKINLFSIIGNLKQSKKRIEAQTKTVETAERGYKIVTARYMANSATQLEVNDAQLALDQAKLNRIQAIYDYLVAVADFEQIIGSIPNYAIENEE